MSACESPGGAGFLRSWLPLSPSPLLSARWRSRSFPFFVRGPDHPHPASFVRLPNAQERQGLSVRVDPSPVNQTGRRVLAQVDHGVVLWVWRHRRHLDLAGVVTAGMSA